MLDGSIDCIQHSNGRVKARSENRQATDERQQPLIPNLLAWLWHQPSHRIDFSGRKSFWEPLHVENIFKVANRRAKQIA